MSWPLVKLGDVAPAKASKHAFSTSDEVWTLNLDQVEADTGNLLGKVMAPVSEAGISTHGFDERHVLYSKLRPYLNKVVLPDEKGLATTELVPMLPDPLRLDRKYLAYYLRSKSFVSWVSSQVAGAKMPRVSMQLFWQHEIPLPPLPEQKRIVALLDKADAIRRKRQQAIQLADDFLRSVFLDMFGDPVTNPKGWNVNYLRDLGSFKNGLNYGREESGANIPILGVGDFKSLDRIDGVSAFSNIHLNILPSAGYLLEDGDLVFVRSNGNKDLVGRCITVYPGGEKLTFSGFCIRFRVSNEAVCAEYLKYLFRMPSVKNKMLKGGQGANIQNINQEMLSEMVIPVPSIELQNRFLEKVEAFKRILAKGDASFDNVQHLLRSISVEVFSGQL